MMPPDTLPPTPDDPFPVYGDFDARQDWFARRLEGRSQDDRILLAARAALRILPSLASVMTSDIHNEKAQNAARKIVFPLIGCHILSIAFSIAPPLEKKDIRSAAASLFNAADIVFAATTTAATNADASVATQTAADLFRTIQIGEANAAAGAAYSALAAVMIADKASAAAYSAAAYANKYSADTLEADLAQLDGSSKARERLATSTLWLSGGGQPKIIPTYWDILSAHLRTLGDDWDVWAEWYGGKEANIFKKKDVFAQDDVFASDFPGVMQGAKNGRYLFGLRTERALKLWRDVALLPNDLWEGEPAKLNAEFKRLVKEAREEESTEAEDNADFPTIPTPKPSAIEPVWEDGRLILPAIPAPSDGEGENVLAALLALREDFAELVEDTKGETNIDARALTYLSRLAERIPTASPTNLTLHRIAQNESALQAYGKTVTDEWPDFLAVRYHALVLQFTRTMAQFPNWREFKRIASQADLTKEQVEEAPQLARELAEALQSETLEGVVDPAISEALIAFANLAESGEGESIVLGKDMLAVDLLNSIETTLIRLAEAALAFRKGTGQLAGKAWNEFKRRGAKSIVEQAGKAGDAVGPAVAKWFKYSVRIGLGGACFYGWLEAIIKLLG